MPDSGAVMHLFGAVFLALFYNLLIFNKYFYGTVIAIEVEGYDVASLVEI